MPDGGSGEKTEKATSRKRQDERKKGNVFMSKDITTVVSLIVGFYGVGIFFGRMVSGVEGFYYRNTQRMVDIEVMELEHVYELIREGAWLLVTTALPFMMLVGVSVVIVVLAQTKMLVSGEAIKFKLDRLNPLNGIKKMFSLRGLVELVKSLIKIVLLIWLLYGNIARVVQAAPAIMDWELDIAISYAGTEIMALIRSVAIAFGTVAAVDYLYQRWEYEKNIMMTKQEVKDEYKQMEGNPEIKGKRKQKQQEMAMKRMMGQVRDADVVVRNPTHFAVALRYKPDDLAPTVLAMGADKVALRIIEEATKHGVTVIENRPLARSLYELAKVDEMIPAELYQPVAELLAWLYTSKNQVKQSKAG